MIGPYMMPRMAATDADRREAMKKKRQRLAAVRVATDGEGAGAAAIVPVEGGTIEELLAGWRVVQIQPLGPLATGSGAAERYLALLLLEEVAAEEGLGRLGFGAT
jgi:hypothetical protein